MVTVLLVRHADVDQPPAGGDPSLNAAGRARAVALAHAAGAAGVTAVFTSPLARTKETAGPLAAALRLHPQEVPAPPALAQQVRAGAAGPVVLVVGHTNTVPPMIAALGVPPPPVVIGDDEFDNLFVVTVPAAGSATLVRLRYGERSP